jgi:hypothetical protein
MTLTKHPRLLARIAGALYHLLDYAKTLDAHQVDALAHTDTLLLPTNQIWLGSLMFASVKRPFGGTLGQSSLERYKTEIASGISTARFTCRVKHCAPKARFILSTTKDRSSGRRRQRP